LLATNYGVLLECLNYKHKDFEMITIDQPKSHSFLLHCSPAPLSTISLLRPPNKPPILPNLTRWQFTTFLCKTNPILARPTMNLTLYLKRNYEKYSPLRTVKNKPNFSPNKPNFKLGPKPSADPGLRSGAQFNPATGSFFPRLCEKKCLSPSAPA